MGIAHIFMSLLKQALVLVVLMGCAMVWVLRNYRRKKSVEMFVREEYQACHAVLKKMDRFVETLGYVRKPGETLLQFSRRLIAQDEKAIVLKRIRNWYAHYSTMRYDPSQEINVLLPQLESEFMELKAQVPGKVS